MKKELERCDTILGMHSRRCLFVRLVVTCNVRHFSELKYPCCGSERQTIKFKHTYSTRWCRVLRRKAATMSVLEPRLSRTDGRDRLNYNTISLRLAKSRRFVYIKRTPGIAHSGRRHFSSPDRLATRLNGMIGELEVKRVESHC